MKLATWTGSKVWLVLIIDRTYYITWSAGNTKGTASHSRSSNIYNFL